MDLVTGVQTPLDPTADDDEDPIFSPDQGMLLFVPDAPAPGTNFSVWLMNVDGSGPTR